MRIDGHEFDADEVKAVEALKATEMNIVMRCKGIQEIRVREMSEVLGNSERFKAFLSSHDSLFKLCQEMIGNDVFNTTNLMYLKDCLYAIYVILVLDPRILESVAHAIMNIAKDKWAKEMSEKDPTADLAPEVINGRGEELVKEILGKEA